jgi:putative hydrolase of the HAD superfamily
MNTIIFDMDDTLVVEEESARAAFLTTCEFAQDRCGVAQQELHAAVRQSCRALWHESPARAYCLQVGISSWEGLWAEFLGPDENLAVLRNWSETYRTSSWHEALRTCGHDCPELASELGNTFMLNHVGVGTNDSLKRTRGSRAGSGVP